MAKSAVELNGMLVEEIEELAKKFYQLAEEYEAACKAGDGFQAYFVIGELQMLIFSLKVMGRRCHEMNRPDAVENRHSRLQGLMALDIPKDRLEKQRIEKLISQEIIVLAMEAQEDGT